ncbi:MAG: metal-sensitive transcriptional regulator [Alphaproteobacteria bacterium]
MKSKRKAEYAQVDASSEIKRLNRVIGQVEGVQKMLADGRKLKDVLIQCRAIHSALKSVEHRVFKAHVDVALEEVVKMGKKKDRSAKVVELEELFQRAE